MFWRNLVIISVLLVMATGCASRQSKGKYKQREGLAQSSQNYNIGRTRKAKNDSEVRKAIDRASRDLYSGDLDSATKEVRRAISLDAKSSEAYTIFAAVEDRRGNAKQAGVYYKKSADLAPNSGATLNNYGAWLCANGFEAEALVWFDRALTDPEYRFPASAMANAGGCALKVGQIERAKSDLRNALEREPTNAYALESMAKFEYSQARYFEARAFVERRLAAAPPTIEVLTLAANIENQLGDSKAAERYLEQIRTKFPTKSQE